MKIKVTASIWDDNDYIISIRDESFPVWKDFPIGPTLDEKKAKEFAAFLQIRMPYIQNYILKLKEIEDDK